LDSLEQTIATLLEGMDYEEDYANSAPSTFSSAADTTTSISPSGVNPVSSSAFYDSGGDLKNRVG
jgi:hypothetical protein